MFFHINNSDIVLSSEPYHKVDQVKHIGEFVMGKKREKKPEKGDMVEFEAFQNEKGKYARKISYLQKLAESKRSVDINPSSYFYVLYNNNKIGFAMKENLNYYSVIPPTFDPLPKEQIEKEKLYRFTQGFNKVHSNYAKVVKNSYKSRPCVRENFIISRQLHSYSAILNGTNQFRKWLLHVYGHWQIIIIVSYTGAIWEQLRIIHSTIGGGF